MLENECFVSNKDLVRPRKKPKLRHLSTICLAYVQTTKGSNKQKD